MFFRKKYDFNTILDKYLDGDFTLFACGEDAPRESEIKDFERQIGYKLPNDFREFSKSNIGGLYIEVKEEKWPRAKLYDVAPFWSFLYGMFVYGFGKDIPEWMDIKTNTVEFRNETKSDYTPFFKVIGDGNVYCFDRNQNIFIWNHEIDEYEPIEKTFTEIFEFEIAELRKRKDRKLEELSKIK